MSGTVAFVSGAFADSSLILRLTTDIAATSPELATEASRLFALCEPVPDRLMPSAIWRDHGSGTLSRLPALFYANGYWCVSSKAARVLRDHELGRNRLLPVHVFQSDRKTPVAGDYFVLDPCETRPTLVPDASPSLRLNPYAKTPEFNLPYVLADGDVAAANLPCDVALWRDRSLPRAFFVSGNLGDALCAAGLGRAFRLFPCRLA